MSKALEIIDQFDEIINPFSQAGKATKGFIKYQKSLHKPILKGLKKHKKDDIASGKLTPQEYKAAKAQVKQSFKQKKKEAIDQYKSGEVTKMLQGRVLKKKKDRPKP